MGEAIETAPAWWIAGRDLEHRGDWSAAESTYRQMVLSHAACAEAWMRIGIVCLKQQKANEAAEALARAVEITPGEPDAWSYYGVALSQCGDSAAAETAFRTAVNLSPDRPDLLGNLGNALRALGRHGEAAICLRRALKLHPTSSAALHNLALVLREQGEVLEAVSVLQRLLRVQPQHLQALMSLGEIQLQLGNAQAALDGFQRALELTPGFLKARIGVGVAQAKLGMLADAIATYRSALLLDPSCAEAHSNLGMALTAIGNDEQGLVSLRTALHYCPGHLPTLQTLGQVYLRLGRLSEAEACFLAILERQPKDLAARTHLGTVLVRQGKLAESEQTYRSLLQERPDDAEIHNSLGIVFDRAGRMADAQRCFRRAIELLPDFAEAHCNLAVVKLTHGRWAEGFAEYEWRWKCAGNRPRNWYAPQWQGEPLTGKTIVLHAEQGRGDTIQFIRLAGIVKQLGARVIVACPGFLIPLLSSYEGVDELVRLSDPPPRCDFHAPLMSLPGILEMTPDKVPCAVPYLSVPAARVAQWRRYLAGDGRFSVGISWRGNPEHACDNYRSVSLEALRPLLHLPNVRFVSIQRGRGSEEVEQLAAHFDLVELGSHLDVADGAFLDTAAVMHCLDLMISVDSAPAHLAGALGIPVWVALGFSADWRWLKDRKDSPWYPTMQLFRQPRPGEWHSVFESMSQELKAVVAARQSTHGRAVTGETTPGRGTVH
ncbi:MAG: tetratricopeptide repeat protein [Pirellulaceae bacterium]